MKPDRYEPSSPGRRRLSGTFQKRGSKLGISTWGGFLFGGVFVAVGTWIILVGTRVIAVNPSSVHAPYWVLTVAGASFAAGGLMVWGMAWKQFAANRQRLQATRQYPNEPALADYHWHPEGFQVSEWPGLAKALALALGLTVFLSMFNWWAFVAQGPWMVKGIVILFDCVAVLTWVQAAQQLGRAIKFGHSRIVFSRFPYSLSEPIYLRWQAGGGISSVRKGTFTLRCVEEWMESRGSGKDRSSYLVHEELWSGTWFLEQPRNFGLREEVELSYNLPADARPTSLNADKPLFWELEVKLDLPGLDFRETYLVPIYDSRTSSEAKATMNEFAFSCPACGQNILCEPAHVGTKVSCPGCNATLVVPKPNATPADVSTRTETPPALPANTAKTAQQTSGLAVASLVCSLLSLVTVVGWLPGIICGHIAKSRIRRNPLLKGNGLATAGLLLGYLTFMSELMIGAVLVMRLSLAVKQGYESVRQDLSTNNILVAQNQPAAPSNSVEVLEQAQTPVAPAKNQNLEFSESGWTSNLAYVSFPNHPIRGTLHGMDFTVRTAAFRNGDLKLTSTNRLVLDIFRLGSSIEGQSYEIGFEDESKTNPHVKLSWNDQGAIQTMTFMKGFGMKLQFGRARNRKLPGKLYLCFPDDSKSYAAGTFQLRVPASN